MKRYLNFAFYYFLFAMAGGVFYREFTKFLDFSGKTSLSLVHVHLMVLGTFLFLLLALFTNHLKLEEERSFRRFLTLYSIALPFMVIMMLVRGVLQVLGTSLSSGANAAISLEEERSFRRFLTLYSIALPFMVIMMLVRGVLQVLGTSLSSGANAAIS